MQQSSNAAAKTEKLQSFGWERAFNSEYSASEALVPCEEEPLPTRNWERPLADIEPNQLPQPEAAKDGKYIKKSAKKLESLAWDRAFETDYDDLEAIVPCEAHTPEKGHHDAHAGALMTCPAPLSPTPAASGSVLPPRAGPTAKISKERAMVAQRKRGSADGGTSGASTHRNHTSVATPPPKGPQSRTKAATQVNPKQRAMVSEHGAPSATASSSKPPKGPVPSQSRQTPYTSSASKTPTPLSQKANMICTSTSSTPPKPGTPTASTSLISRKPATKTSTALPAPSRTMSKPKGPRR